MAGVSFPSCALLLSKEHTPPPNQMPLLETHELESGDEKKEGKEMTVLRKLNEVENSLV